MSVYVGTGHFSCVHTMNQVLKWFPELGCSISVTAHANNRSRCVYWKPSVVCTVSNVKLITSCATEGFPQCCSTMCTCMQSLFEAELGRDSTTTTELSIKAKVPKHKPV